MAVSRNELFAIYTTLVKRVVIKEDHRDGTEKVYTKGHPKVETNPHGDEQNKLMKCGLCRIINSLFTQQNQSKHIWTKICK